jgi:RNA polymerase sigma factor (sigma-70 family)
MNEQVVQCLIGKYYGCNCHAGNQLRDEVVQQVGMWVFWEGIRGLDIDDVTTDAICRVLQTKGRDTQFSTARGSSFRRWLRRFVGNAITDFYRQRQRIRRHEVSLEGTNPPTKGPTSEDLIAQQEEHDAQLRALRRWLGHLSERQRQVMEVILERLAAQQGMPTNQEIADELQEGITAENVAVIRHNAIQALQGFAAQPA